MSNANTRPSTTQPIKRISRQYQQRFLKRKWQKLHEAQAFTITTEEKAFLHRLEQVATTVTNKIKQQFGFVADPNKTLLHNASSTLAHTPTWYYFSRPSHLAFHNFTRRKQPERKTTLVIGPRKKVYSNTTLY